MKDEKQKKSTHNPTPKWLKTIQLNSWEAELLISALVLYALFQIPDYLDQLALRQFDRGSRMHMLFGVLEKAFHLLSFGYIAHILVRGIWVSIVGLSYVYPNGIDTNRLRFKGNFRKELQGSESLVNMVLKLEEASSILYGISFLFFGTFIGFGSFILSYVFLIEYLYPIANEHSWLMALVVIFTIFYSLAVFLIFIDFLTNGFFRRKEWSSDWFYGLARVFRVITLSFLYRRSLLVMISNTKGWKQYLIPFMILLVVGGYLEINSIVQDNQQLRYYQNSTMKNYNPANYENIRTQDDFVLATIQSDILSENTIRLFLSDIDAFDRIYTLERKLFSDLGSWDAAPIDSVNAFFGKRLKVCLDGQPLKPLRWNKTQHPSTYTFGFTTFIRIDSLEKGPHELTIGIDTVNLKKSAIRYVEKEDYSLQQMSHIYFIYD